MKLKVEQLWKQGITNFKYTDTYWYLVNRNGTLNKNRNIILIYAR
jgi:hypothetical protein